MRSTRHISMLARGALLLLPFLGGCSLGTDVDRPEWARIIITASSPLRLELVISQKFLVTEGSVQLIEATTDTISVPFDERYTLVAPSRFFVRAANPTQQTVSFHLKILMEERVWVDDDEIVAPGEKVEFVYRYDEPVLY